MRTESQRLLREAIKHRDDGDVTAAINCLHTAIDLDPDSVRLWQQLASYQNDQGDLKAAIDAARRAVDLSPDPGADGIGSPSRLLGLLLVNMRHFKEAIKILRPALKSDTDGGAHSLMGIALHHAGRGEEAKEIYYKALEINPRNEEVIFNLAVVLRGEDPDRAIELLRKAIEIDPDSAPAYRELGRGTYCHLDDADDAEKLLRRALELKEKDPWTHHYYAYVMSERGRYEEAEKHWLRALELSPDWVDVICELGVLYQNMNQGQKAEKALRSAVEIAPKHCESLHELGSFLVEQGRLDEARPFLKRALNAHASADKPWWREGWP